jgi:tripartite-type tricarboxylate transporter receptor subunit TctC
MNGPHRTSFIEPHRAPIMNNFGRTSIAALIAVAATFTTPIAFGQDAWPTKPVTMIVPFPPGGGTDTGARWVAEQLSKRWGQAVIVDNKPGAAGMIGAEVASRAKPDGYTIMMSNAQVAAINPSLYKKMSYDADKAFTPISLVAELPLVLLVTSALPINSTKDFVDAAKAKPGELSYGSAGNGSSTHLAASLFEAATNTKLMHVPYKGGGPAMQDLMAGQVNLTFLTVLESGPAIKSGRVRPIAVTSLARSPAMPNLPTLAESGIPGYFSISWIGLLAPTGTPKAIVDKVAKDVQEIVNSPEMKARFIEQGATPVGSTPAQFQALIDSEKARYKKIITEKNISATE